MKELIANILRDAENHTQRYADTVFLTGKDKRRNRRSKITKQQKDILAYSKRLASTI